MLRMTKKLAKKWVKNLRSKKFKQTKGWLHRVEAKDNQPAGYCCLGVLATICGVDERAIREENSLFGERFEACKMRDANGTPEVGRVKIRVGNKHMEFDDLADANDRGASFRSIATWIEKNWKLL